MLKPRIIPCLLIHNKGLVKTQRFLASKYIGDPINAIKIFNEKEADELIVLDIDATVNKTEPNYALIAKLAAECQMPLCYGGGITTAEQAFKIIDLGVEKIAMSAAVINNFSLLTRISNAVGCQSVVGVIDIRKKKGFFAKGYEVCTHNANIVHDVTPVAVANSMQLAGVGEIILNSVDRDGQMQGYDIELAKQMQSTLKVPLTMLGGCGSFRDIAALIEVCGIVGAAVGSLFVFKGPHRAVLINYPTYEQKKEICQAML